MSRKNKKDWVNDISEKLERKETKKRNRYVNNDSLESVLDIPLIGGIWYVLRRFKQALYVNRLMKQEYLNMTQLKDQVKNVNLIKDSIRQQLNNAMVSTTVKKFKVPNEYMHEFLMVKEEFPNVVFIHEGDNTFTIVVEEEDIIF